MAERLIVIGGDAAGMSAASQAKKLRKDGLDVVAFERTHHVSYSACGIPYWAAGDVDDGEDLVVRTPEEHRKRGIDLRMRTEVIDIDLDRREVGARELDSGRTYRLGFDHLVVATGAEPVRPSLPGVDAEGIYGVQTLDDGAAVIDAMERKPEHVVVVGGGYIGIEMAEAMVKRDLEVTVVDQAPEPMSTLDPDMGRLVHDAMEQDLHIDVRTETPVEGFDVDGDGRVRGVVTKKETIPADLVILGIGVRPNTVLAKAAGLPLGDAGGVRTDLQMRVLYHDGVWAAGDCVEVLNLVSGQYGQVALGTHANKQGRVVGLNIGGSYATFPGVVGTAMTKVCDLEIARSGLREKDADRAGYAYVTGTIESTTRAGYFPRAHKMTVKMIAERRTGRLLGAQIVGWEGSAKRIDVVATALFNQMTVEQMTQLDLGYAPPFSPVWDPVLVAARKVAEAVGGSAPGE
jgi:NADPH-dependent 2,4-dienoyl-CoA reductase/sulfur reductase-like enzyme